MATEIQQVDLELDMGPKSCKSKCTPSECYFNGAKCVLTNLGFGFKIILVLKYSKCQEVLLYPHFIQQSAQEFTSRLSAETKWQHFIKIDVRCTIQ